MQSITFLNIRSASAVMEVNGSSLWRDMKTYVGQYRLADLKECRTGNRLSWGFSWIYLCQSQNVSE
jgi:hypothetical protein